MKYFLPFFFLFALKASAQGYTPLEPLPFVTSGGQANLGTFIPGAVQLAIAVAGGLAVIRIIIGGLQYMTTDAWSGKSDAKNTITNAIFGLILAMAAAGILYVINPNILNFQLSIQKIDLQKQIDNTIQLGGTTNQSAADLGCTNNCIDFPQGIPIKGLGPGVACSNTTCFVNATLASRLRDLNQAMSKSGVLWQVTEAYPPTVPHIDSCHKPGDLAGTCVDAALVSDPTVDNVLVFLKSIQQTVGNNFEYEVCVNGKNPLVNEPKLAAFKSKLKCEQTTTAPNAHIEL